MLTHKDTPVYSFESNTDFYDWLSLNFQNDRPFWLRYFKKATNKLTIIHDEAVDVALCFGWIDGLLNKYDEISYLVRFTQRRPKSKWSKINVERVERLIEDGLMQPSGLYHVDLAKKDGRWDQAYEPASRITIPEDFLDVLNVNPSAKAMFETLNKANIYAIAFRITTTTNPDRRKAKIMDIVDMLADGEKFH